MYESFYGFKEKPFNLLPDPDYLYMSQGHENAYTHLEYAILENKGFVIITGEIGSGKTTLINFLLQRAPEDIQVGIINNTDVTPLQFIKMMLQEFEIEVEGSDKASMLAAFSSFLVEKFALNNRVVLIVDEAQNLPKGTLEEIRMLSNLETEKSHLIQIILVGQPELKSKLQDPGMAQFVQRVTVYSHLQALKEEDVEKYIHHRLKVAGAKNYEIFNREAIEAIFKYSRGIPRVINSLCDTALVFGYADDLKVIEKQTIVAVVESRDLGLTIPVENESEKKSITKASARKRFSQRIKSMEKRMASLQSTVDRLESTFELLIQTREKRDSLSVELFNMLKKSMDSRSRLTAKYLQLKMEKERNSVLNPEQKVQPKASLFSRQKGKELKKG